LRDNEQYQQAHRLLSISTPLGKDVLILQALSGWEGISRPFSFDLELLAPDNPSVNLSKIVGQNVTITIQLPDGSPRYINGYVSRFAQAETDDRYFTHYTARVVPWLWFLLRHADCRIFQNMTAPDIISQVFGLFSFARFRQNLTATYAQLEYCVQYRETAFNFVSRLMEQFGIFYYFDHSTEGQHTLVMCDGNADLPVTPGSPLSYDTMVGGFDDPGTVSEWHIEQELETGKYSLTDYNFTTPSASLLAEVPTVVSVAPNQGLEMFDYPGPHTTQDEGTKMARLRMQEEEVGCMVATASSNCRGLMSGYTFELQNHYRDDQNATYLITEIQHLASEGTTLVTGGRESASYSNHFNCIPVSTPYRPSSITRKPFVPGPQPALVVGKSGEEIWTDNYGRVKVQFYWDRLGKRDENSSCWVRVSNPWAGKNWGAIFLPRIGQEVIVDFLEGDPDRPIIMGRVYNADQMPPGALPDDMNISGFRTHSTKGGGDHDANVLGFDDTKGSEYFYMRAEKDMAVRVQNNEDHHVYNNQTITVDNDRTETVTKGNETVTIQQGNRSHTVSQGNESLTVSQGTRTVTVQGDDTHEIKQGDRSVTLDMGNDSLTISMGNQTTKLNLGASSTEAMQSITLKVGQSSITIDQMGVTIQGMMISVEGQIQTQIKGLITQVSADAMLQCKGAITMIN